MLLLYFLFFFLMIRRPPKSTLFPSPTLVRIAGLGIDRFVIGYDAPEAGASGPAQAAAVGPDALLALLGASGDAPTRLSARLAALAQDQDDSVYDLDVFATPAAWMAAPEPEQAEAAQAPADSSDLHGVVLSSVVLGRRPMARFGNELRFIGDRIGSLAIVGIDEDGVELARDGTRYRLPVGESKLVTLVDER